jgi:hypothetical protein
MLDKLGNKHAEDIKSLDLPSPSISEQRDTNIIRVT